VCLFEILHTSYQLLKDAVPNSCAGLGGFAWCFQPLTEAEKERARPDGQNKWGEYQQLLIDRCKEYVCSQHLALDELARLGCLGGAVDADLVLC